MKTRKLFTIILILTVNISLPIAAMGAQENEKAYNAELKQEFDTIIDAVQSENLSANAAKKRLETLRKKYDISYTDKAGIIDSIIDHTAEKYFSAEEAEFYFSRLQSGTLMAYRKETHIRKLISLLEEKLDESGPDALLPVLEHYYEFTGLDIDDDYYRLREVLSGSPDDVVSASEIKSGLEKIKAETYQGNRDRSLSDRESSSDRNTGSLSENMGTAEQAGNTQQAQNNASSQLNGNQPAAGHVNTSPQQQNPGGQGANDNGVKTKK